ncbi:sensor histidine kinase [uncultured Friedmanniella sp.]|uniref:sensor histidine kinase n=1 Tax=uncultured Friedmanniella sp. TaxID=335381 RepID=UPI0035CA58F2
MPSSEARPLRRRQEVWRYVVVVLLGLLGWTFQFTEEMSPDTFQPVLDLVVGTAAIVAMHWRRRWPAAVAGALALSTAVSALSAVAALLAFVSLVTTRRWRAVVPVALAFLGSALLYDLLVPTVGGGGEAWRTTLLGTGVVLGICCIFGLYLRARRDLVDSRRDRAETAEREQIARLEQARLSERTRIAREMHDVLAHRISLVSLHAGAMVFREDLSAEELRASARVVQENAHAALGELRDVLGVLRDPAPAGAAPTPAPPQPQLADLPALLEEARAAGTPVRLEGTVPAAQPGAGTVGRTAYRIVQESLTNARKHAPGEPVRLRLDVVDDRLEIVVSNPLRPVGGVDGSEPTGAGLGLVGLTERAELVGGALEHQRHADRYELRGWLPWTT